MEQINYEFVGNQEMRVKRNKKIIIAIIFLVILVGAIQKTRVNNTVLLGGGLTIEGATYIHEMSNTVISAFDIWETREINEKSIKKALKYAKNDEIATKYILQWKEGNFEGSKILHNHVWRMLEGTKGKAMGLNHGAIEEVQKRLKK